MSNQAKHTETIKLLFEALSDRCLSKSAVYKWNRRFREGRKWAKDDDNLLFFSSSKYESRNCRE